MRGSAFLFRKGEGRVNLNRRYLTGLFFLLIVINGFARTSYTGYSGAPGSRGQCAASCHGGAGGTIQVTGFPTAYYPGQQYTIIVSRSSGNSINQFNGSIRIGTGSENAGVITASTGTATYNVAGETNGIHLSTANQTSATFLWTAPVMGRGSVKLYLAGMQGTSISGANTNLTLTSSEQTTGMDGGFQVAHDHYLLNNYPNPFNTHTLIKFTIPESRNVKLDIYDLNGRKIANIFDGYINAGDHSAIWNAAANPSGIYFCRMSTDGESITKRIILIK